MTIQNIKDNLKKSWAAETDRSAAIFWNRAKRDFIKANWAGFNTTTEDDFCGFASDYHTKLKGGA